MSRIPEEVLNRLRTQVEEEYEVLLRYRSLKNNANNPELRREHEAEICLRQQNIAEIETAFLGKVQATSNNMLPADIQQIVKEVIEGVKTMLEKQAKPIRGNNSQGKLRHTETNQPTNMRKEEILKLIDENVAEAMMALQDILEKENGTFNDLRDDYISPPQGFSLGKFRARLKVFVKMEL